MTCIRCGKKMTQYDVRKSHNGICAKCVELQKKKEARHDPTR